MVYEFKAKEKEMVEELKKTNENLQSKFNKCKVLLEEHSTRGHKVMEV